jgi:hypothetical protein
MVVDEYSKESFLAMSNSFSGFGILPMNPVKPFFFLHF